MQRRDRIGHGSQNNERRRAPSTGDASPLEDERHVARLTFATGRGTLFSVQQGRGNRRGLNFTVRLTEDERQELLDAQARIGGPSALGPWLVWASKLFADVAPSSGATDGDESGALPCTPPGAAVPASAEDLAMPSAGAIEALPPGPLERALPNVARARAMPDGAIAAALPPVGERLILDLCAGSGAWSEPYAAAGYRVERVDLPRDVRTYVPPPGPVWGVLCAPPCTHFSLARRDPPDFVEAMACVNACLRIVFQCAPAWWALENPTGLLSKWLGRPRDVFQPCDFGDRWTKRTALWGDFARPVRAYTRPLRRWGPDIGARTPPGFAAAFARANP